MDKPEYIPLPRTGTKCPYCGLSRSGIYNLIRPTKANGYKAVVDSMVSKLPDKTRGRRLVHYASLMSHLDAQVVPVEMLNLRRAWRKFRAQPKGAHELVSVDFGELEFLSDGEAETVEKVASAALHCVSRLAKAKTASGKSDDCRNDSAV